MFKWGRRLPPEALFFPGLERAPCHATHYDFLEGLDVDAVEQVLGAWVHEHGPGDHLALDGERLRGIVGQLRVPPDGGEIAVALVLLKAVPLAGTVVTGDAASFQRRRLLIRG